jgi:hypothetical protein
MWTSEFLPTAKSEVAIPLGNCRTNDTRSSKKYPELPHIGLSRVFLLLTVAIQIAFPAFHPQLDIPPVPFVKDSDAPIGSKFRSSAVTSLVSVDYSYQPVSLCS